MKQLLLLTFTLLGVCSLQAQIFVNTAATGNNDGSSWANAFVHLSDAIAASEEGDEIWVAQGTYLPGGLAAFRDTSFYLNHNVRMYGGFVGTESGLNERGNYESHPTILSGDVEGNDIAGNFTDNRDDNCRHVMFLDTMVSNDFVLDGFFIQNGQTDGASGSGNDRRAGGILSYGAPIIENCTFIANYGYFAGALYPRAADATGIKVRNCQFFGNRAQSGGAMYLVSIGAGLLEDCLFEDNQADGFGGAIYNQASIDTFINCEFIRNQAGADSRGGAMYVTECFTLLQNVTFANNDASSRTGGAIHFNADDDPCVARVVDCTFRGNAARWGGGLTLYGTRCRVDLENSEFSLNEVETSGGAVSVGFAAQLNVDNCLFQENTSSNFAGAIFMQNDSSSLNLNNSSIISNVAENDGGGFLTSAGAFVNIFNTVFESNSAALGLEGGFGGAISFAEDSFDLARLTIDRSSFIANYASDQGGALSLVDVDATITNSLFVFNSVGIEGIAGAISHNAVGTGVNPAANLNLMNNTIALNEGGIAGGLVAWAGPDGGITNTVLQNNIFSNPGSLEIGVEDGSPSFRSNGGNLSLDAAAAAYLDNMNDLLGADPLFVDAPMLDFSIKAESPAVNAGVNDGAPDVDIDGNARDDGMVDIGCYEAGSVSNENPDMKEDFKVLAFPTVTDGKLRVQAELSGVEGVVKAGLFSLDGRRVWQGQLPVVGHQIDQVLQLNNILPGRYMLRLFTPEGVGGANVIIVQ